MYFFSSIILVSIVNEYSLVFIFVFSIIFFSMKILFDIEFRSNLKIKDLYQIVIWTLLSLIIVLSLHSILFFEKLNIIESSLLNKVQLAKIDLYSIKNPFEYFINSSFSSLYELIFKLGLEENILEQYNLQQEHIKKYGINTIEFTYFIGVMLFIIFVYNSIYQNLQIKIFNSSLIIFSLISFHSYYPFSLLTIFNMFVPEIRAISRIYSIIDIGILINLFLFLNFGKNKFLKYFSIIIIIFELLYNQAIFKGKIKKFDLNKIEKYENHIFLIREEKSEQKQLINFLKIYQLDIRYVDFRDYKITNDNIFYTIKNNLNYANVNYNFQEISCDKNDICKINIIKLK